MPARAIAETIRAHLTDLAYRVPPNGAVGSRGGWRLRDRVIQGRADLQIVAKNSFKAELSLDAFSESLRHDWQEGTHRIERQEASLRILRDANAPAAWLLVTAYYCAWFAAIELLKGMGKFVMYFDDNSIGLVRSQALGTDALEAGTYQGAASPTPAGDICIRLTKTGQRPHVLAWKSLIDLDLSTDASSLDLAQVFQRFLGQTKGQSWPNPSSTRNKWNYAFPELYGAAGERESRQMRQLIGDSSASFGWAKSRKVDASEANLASSIVFVRHILIDAAERVSPLFGERRSFRS